MPCTEIDPRWIEEKENNKTRKKKSQGIFVTLRQADFFKMGHEINNHKEKLTMEY